MCKIFCVPWGISANTACVKCRVWEGEYGITCCFQSFRKKGTVCAGLLWVYAHTESVVLQKGVVFCFLPVLTLVIGVAGLMI